MFAKRFGILTTNTNQTYKIIETNSEIEGYKYRQGTFNLKQWVIEQLKIIDEKGFNTGDIDYYFSIELKDEEPEPVMEQWLKMEYGVNRVVRMFRIEINFYIDERWSGEEYFAKVYICE